MSIKLERFTKKFTGGARPNLFQVSATEGPMIGTIDEDLQLLCQGASLPSATFGEIIVPYMGRQLKIPGNRTYDTWDITIINDTNFAIRNAFHAWQNMINHPENNKSASARVGTGDIYGTFKVSQLNSRGGEAKSYTIHNAFPSVVSDIELNWESNDAIETFTVTLNYSHWTDSDGEAGFFDEVIDEIDSAKEAVSWAGRQYDKAKNIRDIVTG